jgi:hypothetical protein
MPGADESGWEAVILVAGEIIRLRHKRVNWAVCASACYFSGKLGKFREWALCTTRKITVLHAILLIGEHERPD